MVIDRHAAPRVGGSLAAAALLAGVTVVSMQLACAIVLVGAVIAVFACSRTSGLIALWMLWLTAPLIRRVFGLIDGYIGADPLALAPFVATAAVAVLQLMRTPLTRRTALVLGAALFGLALGVPAAIAEPRAGIFGLAAYGSAVVCIVLGYGEGAAAGSGFTLRRALFLATPLIAVYGILQYFLPLTEWDERWLSTVDIASIGAPEEDHIRIFATLNSPATLAVVLAIAVLFAMSSGRLSLARTGLIALLMTALGLTFVRSAIVALVGGLVGLAVATRGRAAARIAVLLLATAVPVLVLSTVSPTGQAIVDRVATLGALEGDVSADARVQTPLELLPEAVGQPLGHGLGSAGEATKLRDSGGLRFTDNGYLAMIWQLGPVGFLLVIGSAVAAVAMLARTRPPAGGHRELKGLLMSGLVLLLVLAFGGDIFYGASGAIFWYIVGKALWLADRAPVALAIGASPGVTASLPAGPLHPAPAGAVFARAGASPRPDAPRRHPPTERVAARLPPAVTPPAVSWESPSASRRRRPPPSALMAAVLANVIVLAGVAFAGGLSSGDGDDSSGTRVGSSRADGRTTGAPSSGARIAGPSTPAADALLRANRRRASERRARERRASERLAARRRARARTARAESRVRRAAAARARRAAARRRRAQQLPAPSPDVTPQAVAPPPPPAGVTRRPPPPPPPAAVTRPPPPPPPPAPVFDDSG